MKWKNEFKNSLYFSNGRSNSWGIVIFWYKNFTGKRNQVIEMDKY